jgi:hypothetical protein
MSSMNQLLTNLGVSFSNQIEIELSPEETIISLIRDYNIVEKRRELSLLILAFQTFQDYYRPDLFAHLLKDEDSMIKQVLGGIIFREGLINPTRWSGLFKKLMIDKYKALNIGNQKVVELKGKDRYFSEFTITISEIKKSNIKKMLSKEWVLQRNTWFKNRLIFGASTRADISTIKFNQLESTPYSIAKRFNQSYPSIHGIWNDLIFAQKLGYNI